MHATEDTFRHMKVSAELTRDAIKEYLTWHAEEMTTEQIGQAYYILQRADEDIAHASERLAELYVRPTDSRTASEILLETAEAR